MISNMIRRVLCTTLLSFTGIIFAAGSGESAKSASGPTMMQELMQWFQKMSASLPAAASSALGGGASGSGSASGSGLSPDLSGAMTKVRACVEGEMAKAQQASSDEPVGADKQFAIAQRCAQSVTR
jgi:hypothetical protein